MASDLGERAEVYARETKWAETSRTDDWLAGYRAAIADAAKVVGVMAATNSVGGHVTRLLNTAEEKIHTLAPPG